jgi:hypothetical protein
MPARAVLGGISNAEGIVPADYPGHSWKDDRDCKSLCLAAPAEKEFSIGRDTSDVDYYCREYAK